VGASFPKRFFACAALSVALIGATMSFSGVEAGSTRVERHSYTLGLDAGHVCEAGVGGACLVLRTTDRYVTIDIRDATGDRVDAIYQYTDGYGAIHGTGAVCGKKRLRIPDSANRLDLFLQGPSLGALTCAATDGPAIATTGEIVATFEIGAPRVFPKRRFDTEQDCATQAPNPISLAGVTDDGGTVSLDVVVLLDGVPVDAAKKVFATVAKSYAPLAIKLRVVRYRTVKFVTDDAAYLNSQAKALYGGEVPKGTDVVYTLTTKDIQALNQKAVAGLADCIGGVRYPNRAFAVGEIIPVLNADPLVFYSEGTARATAHEIGHLMGAQHEQANCIQGIPDFALDDPTPCTLMSNFADFVSRDFGVLEAAVVRGHAVNYATP
jgi:predicted Zn-dependent protease